MNSWGNQFKLFINLHRVRKALQFYIMEPSSKWNQLKENLPFSQNFSKSKFVNYAYENKDPLFYYKEILNNSFHIKWFLIRVYINELISFHVFHEFICIYMKLSALF